MSRLVFDGHEVVRRGRDNVDYKGMYERQRERSRKLELAMMNEEASTQTTEQKLKRWQQNVPNTYREASFEKMSHDEGALEKMRELAKAWKKGDRFNVLFYPGNTGFISGKTWAMYAWLHQLVSQGSVKSPLSQIVVTNESVLASKYYSDYKNLDDLFANNPDMRILVIDSIGKTNEPVERVKTMWKLLQEKCRNNRDKVIYLVMVLDKPLFAQEGGDSSGSNKVRKRNRKAIGPVMGDTEPAKESKGNDEVLDSILPIRAYKRSYPDDCNMTKGVMITKEPDITLLPW